MKKRRRSAPRLSLALTLFVAACAVNPATGRREFSLIGEGQEIAMGREADQQVTASYGLVDVARAQNELRGRVEGLDEPAREDAYDRVRRQLPRRHRAR